MSATIMAASAGALAEQIGSYAGYASVIGLGILSLLYFAQAREVKRLREWAGRAPERAAELEERVQADAQKRVVGQPPTPASAAGAQAADARTQAATAAVYASIGAPPPGQLARPGTPGAPAPGAVPPAPAPGPVPAAPAPGAVPSAPAAGASEGTQPATPQTAPPPGGRPIVTATPAPIPAATPAAAAAARVAAASRTLPTPANGTTSQDTTESAAARPQPLPQYPASSPGRFSGDDADDDAAGGLGGLSGGRIAAIVGGAVAFVAVGVVLMFTLGGSEDAPPENNFGNTPSVEEPAAASGAAASGSGSGSSSSTALTSAERRATDLAVLNGTTQTGLARAVANKIQEGGFTIASVATNADQSVPTTVVSYSGDNEPAALAVAKIIGIDRGSVQPADANAAAAATADVIVIVGSDQIE